MNSELGEESSQISRKDKIWDEIYERFEKEVANLNNLLSHQALKGGENEKTFKEFCRTFLPGKYTIETNKVLLDRDGIESTEQDIVIWNSQDQPRIFTKPDKYFLLDTVLMCIEIKTTLDKEKLKDTLLKIQKLRNLNSFKRLDGDKKWQVHPPLCYIFAFDSVWKKRGSILKAITDIIKENNIKPSSRFDFLYLMRKGISLYWDVPVKPDVTDGSYTVDFNKKYGGIIPFNERWPQFFPSKLIKDIPLELHEMQISQKEGYKEGFFNNLDINNQIKGMVSFLSKLCQALEDQKILHSHGQVVFSYSHLRITQGGTYSHEPF